MSGASADTGEGRVVVVTGAAAGMGAATVRRAVSEGARVVAIDRDVRALSILVDGLVVDGPGALPIAADVTSESDLAAALDQVISVHGRLDALLNFAGVSDFEAAETTDARTWERQLQVNLTGTFLACQTFGRAMIAARAGAIVNVASTAGLFGVPRMAAYTAAKHGVVGLTRALAVEWARHGIRVNCLCPGATLTGMLLATSDDFRAARTRRIPLGRFGDPDEQAQAALFLVSPAASYITGVALPVDGGVAALAPGTSDAALAAEA